jgi:transposase
VGEQLTYIIIHKQVQGTSTGALISERGQTESQRHTFFRVCEFRNLVLRKEAKEKQCRSLSLIRN